MRPSLLALVVLLSLGNAGTWSLPFKWKPTPCQRKPKPGQFRHLSKTAECCSGWGGWDHFSFEILPISFLHVGLHCFLSWPGHSHQRCCRDELSLLFGAALAAAPRLSLQCNCRLSWLHQTNSSTNTDILEGFSVAAPKNRPITWSKGCIGCSHELRNSLSLSKGSRKTRHLKQQHRVQFVSHLNGSQPS